MDTSHLAWFLNEDGYPYLYRRDSQARNYPNDSHRAYETAAEACEAAGIPLEEFIRSR